MLDLDLLSIATIGRRVLTASWAFRRVDVLSSGVAGALGASPWPLPTTSPHSCSHYYNTYMICISCAASAAPAQNYTYMQATTAFSQNSGEKMIF